MTARAPLGVVVTGTDTGVGKTVVTSVLLAAARDAGRRVRSWKPFQTGWPTDDDAARTAHLARLAADEVLPPVARLRAPVSPLEAARLEGRALALPTGLPPTPEDAFVVVEGAGGLLVPITETEAMADLFARLGLPLVLVTRPEVGTLNHTALSLEAARHRGLVVAAVAFSGPPTSAVLDVVTRAAGDTPVLVLPRLDPPSEATVAAVARAPDLVGLVRRLLGGPSPVPASSAARLQARDAEAVWHPYTQHGLGRPPLAVRSAAGAWLELEDGRRVLDGISSWWTNLHGHGHPRIAAAIAAQARALDHVQFGGATHEPAVRLAERLLAVAPPGLERVFYSDDGSTAVETALKMALAFHARRGAPERTRFLALEDGYHGDTAGAMSVSATGTFTRDFGAMRFDVRRVPAPVRGRSEAACLAALEEALADEGDRVAALVVEPLLQGAAGMRTYGAGWLRAARDAVRRRGGLFVADEVLTGFGRTGARFACDLAGITPDLLCLSKAITGGTLPLAATLATGAIWGAFLSHELGDAFLHGHSYTANPIACAAALESLDLLDARAIERAGAIGARIDVGLAGLAGRRGVLDVRGLGLVRAVEVAAAGGGYLASPSRAMADAALGLGVLLRPLGNVVYAMPPLCVTDAECDRIAAAMVAAVDAALAG